MPASHRTEHDSMGTVDVPTEAMWGAQTQRSIGNFRIGGQRLPVPLLRAIGLVKLVAARTNARHGRLDEERAGAIARAAREVVDGGFDDQFPLVVWQTGSGTQTNMNVNEVVANRASELLGAPRGSGRVHPNDHVNRSQSSNDVLPTSLHVAAALEIDRRLVPAIRGLRDSLDRTSRENSEIVKVGRTHLQDATPVTFGQEVSAWVSQLDHSLVRIDQVRDGLLELAIGGTAVGTGTGSPEGWPEEMCAGLAEETGLPFRPAPNRFEALASRDAAVFASGALRTLAVSLAKIANDVRWLASGPRSGLGEIRIPENEPGSSIMPGKVNPTQAEAVLMVASRVIGNDATIAVAGASGNFQLNVQVPVIALALLESIGLLADATASFDEHCARGIEPIRERMAELVERSLMLVTALAPKIGYEAAARIAHTAHAEGTSLREAALRLGLVTADEFDSLVRAERMLGPDR